MRDFKFFQKRKVYGVDETLLRSYHHRIHQVYINRYHFSINGLSRMNILHNETRNFIRNSDIVNFDQIRVYYHHHVYFILYGAIVGDSEDIITDSHHERMIRNSEESVF